MKFDLNETAQAASMVCNELLPLWIREAIQCELKWKMHEIACRVLPMCCEVSDLWFHWHDSAFPMAENVGQNETSQNICYYNAWAIFQVGDVAFRRGWN